MLLLDWFSSPVRGINCKKNRQLRKMKIVSICLHESYAQCALLLNLVAESVPLTFFSVPCFFCGGSLETAYTVPCLAFPHWPNFECTWNEFSYTVRWNSKHIHRALPFPPPVFFCPACIYYPSSNPWAQSRRRKMNLLLKLCTYKRCLFRISAQPIPKSTWSLLIRLCWKSYFIISPIRLSNGIPLAIQPSTILRVTCCQLRLGGVGLM